MSLIKCPDCGHDISNEAAMCVHCGHSVADRPASGNQFDSAWQTVIHSKTPINVFALAMMACAAILGISATGIDGPCELTAFIYTLHIFLAVSGMFFVTILFCRKGMYHPHDLAKAKQAGLDDLGEDKPVIAVVIICLMLLVYGLYQSGIFETVTPSAQEGSVASECAGRSTRKLVRQVGE